MQIIDCLVNHIVDIALGADSVFAARLSGRVITCADKRSSTAVNGEQDV